ncbi:MAG: hypothetical protein Q8Q09_10690 [Deltaproteobacteria bacterium]|nr:hypothetical protein [Deltaproteobacteria bacterium]
MSDPALRILHNDHCSVVATAGDLIVVRWRAKLELESSRRAMQAVEVGSTKSKRTAMIVVSDRGVGAPESAIRDELSKGLTQMNDRFSAGAIVVSDEGFVAASVRAALTGMILVVRQPYPLKIVTTLAEAVVFLRSKVPGLPSERDLLAMAQQVTSLPVR